MARGPGDRLGLSGNLTEVDVPDRVELTPGEVASLRLPGLGSAVYRWSFEITGNSDAVEASITSAPPPVPAAEPGGPPPTNYSVDTVVTLRALAEGQAKFRFVQRHPWAADEAPLAEHVVDVVVRGAADPD